MPRTAAALALLVVLPPPAAGAGAADVIGVDVRRSAPGVYAFDVTIRSQETGWDRYADRFEVVAPDGRVLGTRVLLHPHVDEQPFTRSLGGVAVPAGVGTVTVRAHHKPAGYDGAVMSVDLPR